MPELPEVETIRLGLQRKIVGLKIKEVELIQPKSFIGDNKILRGKIVLNITRRAKVLGVELSGNLTLLFHLKMTGQIIYDGGKRFVGGHPTKDMVGKLPNSHTRIIFVFSDDSKLYFNDMRRFGWVKVIVGKVDLPNLGPEPLEPAFTWQILKTNLLRHKNMPIKVALLDQKVVSGIGNIYASEACFDAGVDPRRKVNELSDTQFKKLHTGIVKSLKDGIKYGGSTRANFVDSEGKKGYFLDYAFVYGKDKKLCKVCGEIIHKIQLGGRGTYFCQTCQKI